MTTTNGGRETDPMTYEQELSEAVKAYPTLAPAEAYSQWQLDRYNERQAR